MITYLNYPKHINDIKQLFKTLNLDSQYLLNFEFIDYFLNQNKNILYAYDNNLLVGLIRVIGDDYSTYIDLLCVHSLYQRQRIGSCLVRKIEENLKCKYFSVLCNINDYPFYIKLGFENKNGYLQKTLK